MQDDKLFKALSEAVGEASVTDRREDLTPYLRDCFSAVTSRFFGNPAQPSVAVFPADVGQVQKVIKIANEFRVPVTPITFGSNMGGLAIPTVKGCIMLDLMRMNHVVNIDEESMTATIEPAVTFGKLDSEARKHGLRAVCKNGGWTGSLIGNIVGANMRPFNARPGFSDVVVALEVVLPNGELLRTGSPAAQGYEETNPFARLSWGPDLAGIFRGSLGYYGVVTKAVVRLYPAGEKTVEMLYEFSNLNNMLNALNKVQRKDIGVSALGVDADFIRMSAADPEDRRNPERLKKISEMIKESSWFFMIGLEGFRKRVDAEIDEVERICKQDNGTIVKFPDEKVMNYLMDEATHRGSSTMHHYNGGYMGFHCLIQFSKIAQFIEEVEPKLRQLNLRDVQLPGEKSVPTWSIIPMDRGTTWACGPSINYDATNPQDVEQVMAGVQTIFMSALGMGAAIPLTIPLLTGSIFLESYLKLLLEIKKAVDPNNILVPNKLCKTEE